MLVSGWKVLRFRSGGEGKRKERRTDAGSLQFEKWLSSTIVEFIFLPAFLRFSRRAHSPLRILTLSLLYTSLLLFLSLRFTVFPLFASASLHLPARLWRVSTLPFFSRLMEAHAGRMNATTGWNLTTLSQQETATKSLVIAFASTYCVFRLSLVRLCLCSSSKDRGVLEFYGIPFLSNARLF